MIDKNKQYKTRDGRAVKIYEICRGQRYSVMGAVLCPDEASSYWTSAMWSSVGEWSLKHQGRDNTTVVDVLILGMPLKHRGRDNMDLVEVVEEPTRQSSITKLQVYALVRGLNGITRMEYQYIAGHVQNWLNDNNINVIEG